MIRWLIWGTFIVAWTVALEIPVTASKHLPGGELLLDFGIFFAKFLHGAVYAALALSAAWLPLPGRFRPFLVFVLMAHAAFTELFQEILKDSCHRTGLLSDVCIDQLGILIGMLIGWKWWTRPPLAA